MKRKITVILLLLTGMLAFCNDMDGWKKCYFAGNPQVEWNWYGTDIYEYQYIEFEKDNFQIYLKHKDGKLDIFKGKYGILFNENNNTGMLLLYYQKLFYGKPNSPWKDLSNLPNLANTMLLFRTEGTLKEGSNRSNPNGNVLFHFIKELDLYDCDNIFKYSSYDMDRLFANKKDFIIKCKANGDAALTDGYYILENLYEFVD